MLYNEEVCSRTGTLSCQDTTISWHTRRAQKWRVETHTSHWWLRVVCSMICKINLTVIYIKSLRTTTQSWIVYHLRAYVPLKNNAMFNKVKQTGFRLRGLFRVRNALPKKAIQGASRCPSGGLIGEQRFNQLVTTNTSELYSVVHALTCTHDDLLRRGKTWKHSI